LLLGVAASGTACKALSSRIVSDPFPAIARVRAHGDIREEVDQLAKPLVQSGEVCSMAVGVVTPDGRTHTFGYGSIGVARRNLPPQADSIFQIGSVSKLYVTSLLAVLVDEGRLRYDDTVGSILPPELGLRPEVAEITLRELATHTSGLPRQPQSFAQFRQFMGFLFTGHNFYACIDKPYLYEYLRTCHLKPKAERQFQYSNVGVGLLAHLIEVKTGRSLPGLFEEKLSGPLQLKDTGFVLNAEQQQRLVVGHAGDQPKFLKRNTPVAPWDMGEIMRGSGGMYSTLNDMLSFAKANLRLLGSPLDTVLSKTQAVQCQTEEGGVGLGWTMECAGPERQTIVYRHGMVSGYTAYIALDNETRTAVVVLCGTFNWKEKVGHNLIVRLAGGFKPTVEGDAMQMAQQMPPAEPGTDLAQAPVVHTAHTTTY
jgi:CubicO group peptidase (beta-lactamase class C family)